tara:strand:- start:177 stop:1118 length:942 start_codon:yes stop_codon:yes gene_type:complete
MNDLIVFTHQDCLLKFNGYNHPESPNRLKAVNDGIKELNFKNISVNESTNPKLEIIYNVHPKEYIDYIFKKIPNVGLINLEKEPHSDTLLCPDSKDAILKSCGSGLNAADIMMQNKYSKFFCSIRPPGHHAEKNRANGFCFINNIAVTARYLRDYYSIDKIAIVDFDVHHCNGTQEIFYNDKNVFCASIHESPLFPGTGNEDEKGVGNIFNVPILAGTDSKNFIEIFKKRIINNLDKFKPEIILISAGFDAHKRDPLANINLESEDYYEITKYIVDISNIHSNGRIISFLEGGYDLVALKEGVQNHINALVDN